MISQKSNFVTQGVNWDYLKENVRGKVEAQRKELKGERVQLEQLWHEVGWGLLERGTEVTGEYRKERGPHHSACPAL